MVRLDTYKGDFADSPGVVGFLDECFSHDNPHAAEYEAIMQDTPRSSLKRGGYSRVFYERSTRYLLDEQFARMKQLLEGGILVDLGGGDGKMRTFASEMGCAAYLNVDLAPTHRTDIHAPTMCIAIEADMLRALSCVKTASAHVTLNGIDGHVLGNPEGRTEDMTLPMPAALLREIARVVPPEGLAFGMSITLLIELERMGFRRLFERRAVWQKQSS